MHTIRQATIADVEDLSDSFNKYRMFYGQESDVEGAKNFLFQRFEHLESIVFIAIEEATEKIVGFAQLYPSFSSVSMKRSYILNDLYVEEDYRKQGVAQSLLNTAKEYGEQMKAKGLSLQTSIQNEKAQRLYERNGYEKDQNFYSYYLTL